MEKSHLDHSVDTVSSYAENNWNARRKKLFLTGASGLLGRALFAKFKAEGWDVFGAALTRVQNQLHKLDITNKNELTKAIHSFQPNVVIHAAAQRFPDVVQSNPAAARVLNVDATKYIVDASAQINVPVMYISTDYVFDGKSPPFKVHDQTNPLNMYGQTKLEGEKSTLTQPGNLVLRIPVLYGHVLSLKESAVTCLLDPLFHPDSEVHVSHFEQRCPSHVNDIALICYQLATTEMPMTGIFQWCGKEKMTKYSMTLEIAKAFGLSYDHIKPQLQLNKDTSRPFDPELDRSRLEMLGLGHHTEFQQGVKDVLSAWVSLNVGLLPVRPYTLAPVK